jgi:hypothetical protein
MQASSSVVIKTLLISPVPGIKKAILIKTMSSYIINARKRGLKRPIANAHSKIENAMSIQIRRTSKCLYQLFSESQSMREMGR